MKIAGGRMPGRCLGLLMTVLCGCILSANAEVTNLPVAADTFINAASPTNNAGGNLVVNAGRSGARGVGDPRRGLF